MDRTHPTPKKQQRQRKTLYIASWTAAIASSALLFTPLAVFLYTGLSEVCSQGIKYTLYEIKFVGWSGWLVISIFPTSVIVFPGLNERSLMHTASFSRSVAPGRYA